MPQVRDHRDQAKHGQAQCQRIDEGAAESVKSRRISARAKAQPDTKIAATEGTRRSRGASTQQLIVFSRVPQMFYPIVSAFYFAELTRHDFPQLAA